MTQTVAVAGELTHRTAADFCRLVAEALGESPTELCLDMQAIKVSDVVGLAALRQSIAAGRPRGTRVTVTCGDELRRALVDAQIVEDFDLVPGDSVAAPVELRDAGDDTFSAETSALGLRPPTWEELALFEQWAQEPLLEEMVGSELLYRCRQRGPYHPDFVDFVLHDPRSLTMLVHPLAPSREPAGFIRLYDVHLGQQFAFLETAMATKESLRRGWGIQASRLLLAYALDVLEIHRVEAKVYAYNVLSANSLKRNGFKQEGLLREARLRRGRRWDIVVFSILESEMREQRLRETFPSMRLWPSP
jgi:RimJ/RimL family protein N-acetyltransferase/anti-anti-sigma regulatory factor